MTAAKHIVALVRSHVKGDDDQFLSVAMQVAAHEARQGHGKLAQTLKGLVDEARHPHVQRTKNPVPMVRPKGDLADLVSASYSDVRLSEMVLPMELELRLKRVVSEQKQKRKLFEKGLKPRRKILLIGQPGSGKTMTASALAGEIKIPLFCVMFESLITRFMGETATGFRRDGERSRGLPVRRVRRHRREAGRQERHRRNPPRPELVSAISRKRGKRQSRNRGNESS